MTGLASNMISLRTNLRKLLLTTRNQRQLKFSDGCVSCFAIAFVGIGVVALSPMYVDFPAWVNAPDEIPSAQTRLSNLYKECSVAMARNKTNSEISEFLKENLKIGNYYWGIMDYETGKTLSTGKKCSDSIVLIKAPVDRYQNLGFAINTGQGNKYCITRKGESMKGWSCQ